MSISSSGGRSASDDTPEEQHRAGAFDIRVFIASLIGLYGIVLTIYGIIGSSATQLKKSDQVNVNLWAGIAMIIFAACFVLWARLRPVVVPAHVEKDSGPPTAH